MLEVLLNFSDIMNPSCTNSNQRHDQAIRQVVRLEHSDTRALILFRIYPPWQRTRSTLVAPLVAHLHRTLHLDVLSGEWLQYYLYKITLNNYNDNSEPPHFRVFVPHSRLQV